MNSIMNIDKLNIISDNDYYYFFRALNNDDHNDLIEGINKVDGKITKIRTDLSRYKGIPNYSINSSISLEEMNDHIKWAHTKDTNCISLSSNANVVATYGRSNYHDEYVVIKVKKDEINKNVYLAVSYIANEVEKRIKELIKNDDKKYLVYLIDNCNSNEQLEKVKDRLREYYRLTEEITESTLDSKSLLELKKLILKLDILGENISPSISNRTLIETIKFAYTSSEFIHYKEIPESKIAIVPSEMIDIFSIIQQVPNTKEIDEIKNILLSKLENASSFNYNNSKLNEKEYSIANMYQLSGGSIDYATIKDVINKAYYLAKSRLRVINAVDKLNELLDDPKYQSTLEYLKNSTYGIEPEISSRLNTNSMYLSESVSLNVTKEEQKLLDLIKSLSVEQLNDIVTNKEGYLLSLLNNYINEEYENISGFKKEPVSENEYYVEAILNSIDINTIYASPIKEKKLTKDEKFIICNKLYKGNCKNLYNAFLNAGVDKAKIPYYIVNLYLSNGYKGYNFYDFSVLPELNEIIAKNIDNLNYKVSALDFDNLRNLKDDHNLIEKTNLNLRDYQVNTVNNIKELYKTKRFAGVVLPTGAGKSFVAIRTMLDYQNKNIIYIAPNIGINRQVQRHIIKYIIGYKKPYEEVAKMLENPNNYEMYIKQYFPYLKFYCYQGMSNKEQEEVSSLDADLIILDELHRTGAESWSLTVKNLIDKNPNSKVLGMTATPVRTDGEDMARSIAKLTKDYTQKELILDKHLAANMNLIDAIRDDIVIAPKIVSFDYNLVDNDEYEEIKTKYENEENPIKKEEYKQIYDKMISLLSKSKVKGLSKIIEDNLTNKYGKYLVFLPHMSSEVNSEDYFKEKMTEFANSISNIDSNPIQRYIYSDKSNKDNDKTVTDFELDESSHLKTLFAVDMLNEGIHVDDISGSFMFRPISSSKILYLQQLGRTVFSKDPDIVYKDSDRPIVFDYFNNYFILNMDRMVNKTDVVSDLERLKNIYEWINKHGFIPDINSSNLNEARKAITLKKLKSKYIKYLDSNNLDELDEIKKNTILEILIIANELNLFSIDFGNRIIPPGEKEIDYVDTFELSATQKELVELVKESRSVGKVTKESPKTRLVLCLQILDILDEYSYPIKSITLDTTLKDIKPKLDSYAIELINELKLTDDYPLGKEFNNLKLAFYSSPRMQLFQGLDLDTAINYGLFTDFIDNGVKQHFVENNIIINGPRRFIGFNIITKEKIEPKKGFKEEYDVIKLFTILLNNGYEINNKLIPFSTTLKELKSNLPPKVRREISELNLKDDFNVFIEYEKIKVMLYYKKNKRIIDELDLDTCIKYGLFEELRRAQGGSFLENNYVVKGPDKFIGYNIITKQKKNITQSNSINSSELIQVLDILNKSGYEINHKTIPPEMTLSGLKRKLDEKTAAKIDELDPIHLNAIGEAYNDLKRLLCHQKELKKFEDLELNDAIRLGLLDDFYYNGSLKSFVSNDFIVRGPYRFLEYNIKTKTKYDEEGYDINGLDEHQFNREHFYRNGKSLYNENGFDYKKIHKKTGTFLDPHNFDIDKYWYVLKDGEYKPTYSLFNNRGFNIDGYYYPINGIVILTKYDAEGYDIDGYNREGFNKQAINKYTGTPYDRGGFDINHKLKPIIKIVDGKEEVIERKINRFGFSADRYYWELLPDGKRRKTTRKLSPDGFDYDGICEITGKRYNSNFFDRNGFFWETLPDGKIVKTDRKINNHNFDKEGFYYVEENGELINTNQKYDIHDFNINGDYKYYQGSSNIKYNLRGFNIDGINRYTNALYDKKFFDIDGYYWAEKDGVRVKTDRKLNDEGFDYENNHWTVNENGQKVNSRFNDDGYDSEGYDRLGFRRNKKFLSTNSYYNNEGFDADCNHKDTGKPYDTNFFKINDNFVISGKKYYPSSYINLITGTSSDIRGFDIFGKSNDSNVYYYKGNLEICSYPTQKKYQTYDYCNFDSNGIHKFTKTLFDENGYNAFRVDKNGNRLDGTKHPDIIFAERYLDLINNNINPTTDEQLNNYLEKTRNRLNNIVSKDHLIKIIIYAACKMYPTIIDKIHIQSDTPQVVNIDEILATSKLHIDNNPRLYISLKERK